MKSFFAICLLILFCASPEAATYYISPTGNDAAAGTAVTAPLKTFAVAVPKLKPGDVLTLLDGMYDQANSGFLIIKKLNGTASQPITIKAQNERKAHLHNNGLYTYSVSCDSSSYLVFEGLQVSSADNATVPNAWTGNGMSVRGCRHIVLKRLLVHHNNRYGNTGLLVLEGVDSSLVEDTEFYYHHRHALSLKGGKGNIFRRIYDNCRGYGNLPDGRPNGHGTATGGDMAISIYPGSNNIIENEVSDGSQTAFDMQAVGLTENNRFLGVISTNGWFGMVGMARRELGPVAAAIPRNNTIKDFVAIGAEGSGVLFNGGFGNVVEQATILNCKEGVRAGSSSLGDGHHSFFGTNILAANNDSGNFVMGSGLEKWTLDHPNAFGTSGNKPNYAPATSPNMISPLSIDPKLGTCKVYIPDSSPMKRSGKNGADIGANILYRYQDGVLTNQPLWDPRTGEFPRGAVIAGINDIPGQSLFDVHKRLNVNCNNCPFPAGYPTASAISNAQTSNTAGLQQAFLTITPNFAGSSISIKIDANHPATVEIYNLQGKKIETLRNVNGNSVQWQRGNQPAGVYFVKASSRGVTETTKAILSK